jgi:peptidoglycan/LPS O-acetylase OafA/YrhL
MSTAHTALARRVAGPAPKIAALDGVRGLACLMVLLWHYANFNHAGAWPVWYELLRRVGGLNWMGVDLFFVLSGYLLGSICWRHRADAQFFRVFYVRRACRILPLYYLWWGLGVLLPVLFSLPILNYLYLDQEPLWPYATLVQNSYFTAVNSYGSPWMVMTWSLAVENQFYLLLPLVIRWLPARWLPKFLLGAIVLAPLLRTAIVVAFPGNVMAAYWLLPCRWDALFLGVLAAYLCSQPAWSAHLQHYMVLVRRAFWVTGAALVGFLCLAPGKQAPLMATLGYSIIDFFFCCLILRVIHDQRFSRCFSFRPLRQLGTISYGVYLFHVGIACLLHGLLRQEAPDLSDERGILVTLLAAGVSLLLAWLSYTFIEAPILRFGQQWQYGQAPRLPAAVESGDLVGSVMRSAA